MKHKSKRWVILLVLLLLVLLIPVPSGTYKDGGTKAYTALTYKIVHWKRLIGADGVYEKTRVYPFPLNFSSIDALWTGENVTYDESKEDGSDLTHNEPEAYAFEAQYIRTNGYSGDKSYPYHVVIDSRKDLEAYYEANKDLFDLERREVVYSDTSIGFLDACDKYDDAYFERQNLVLIILEEGSGSIRHEITDVRAHRDNNGASLGWDITIDRIVPEGGTDDMAQWHLFLEVQMGNIIGASDDVWINGKPSNGTDD